MALIPTAQFDADLAAIEWDSPSDLATWNGANYKGRFTTLMKADNLKEGGFDPSYDASFYVRTSLFTTGRPVVDEVLTINGTRFRISSIVNHPDDVDMELQLASL